MPDKGVMEAIKIALEAEKEGLIMFLKFAKDTESITGKNMFITLAQDEMAHIRDLESMATELTETGAIEGNFFEGKPISTINKEELKKKITESSNAEDLDAIDLAIEQEKQAITHYTKCADDAQTDIERKIYLQLMEEEKVHQLILEAEKDSMKGSGFWVDFREFTPEG